MKKFIAAFDGLKFSESTLSYSIYLAKTCHAHLVGVFLEDVTRHGYSMADITRYEGSDFDEHVHALDIRDNEEKKQSIEGFERACQLEGIHYSVHRDRNVALQEILHESIYADMLIIGAEESMSRYEEPAPTTFVRNLLSDAQCPVVLVPPGYKPVEKVVMLYDGEPSSVFALRAYAYLFNNSGKADIEVLTVKPIEESLHLPDNKLMKEFAKKHYPHALFTVLKGSAEDQIVNYLRFQKKELMVVLGAYRRSKLSRLFRQSMADVLLMHLKCPLFIAHNKA